LTEGAFVRIQEQLVLLQRFANLAEVTDVILLCLRVANDVIDKEAGIIAKCCVIGISLPFIAELDSLLRR
jgi:hypothetical protein